MNEITRNLTETLKRLTAEEIRHLGMIMDSLGAEACAPELAQWAHLVFDAEVKRKLTCDEYHYPVLAYSDWGPGELVSNAAFAASVTRAAGQCGMGPAYQDFCWTLTNTMITAMGERLLGVTL